jgi:hypothetical protein
MNAWGFAFSGSAFVWAKATKRAIVTECSVTAAPGANKLELASGFFIRNLELRART